MMNLDTHELALLTVVLGQSYSQLIERQIQLQIHNSFTEGQQQAGRVAEEIESLAAFIDRLYFKLLNEFELSDAIREKALREGSRC